MAGDTYGACNESGAAVMLLLQAAALFVLTAAPLAADPVRLKTLPQLNEAVPAAVRKAQVSRHTCDVGEGHHDPCATVVLRRNRFTVGWDASTLKVTYLYSTTLSTDSELVAGGLGRIDASMDIMPFGGGFVSPDWCDTDAKLSGDALWCAVMKPAPRHYGRVIGFVQSIYLLLPETDQPLLERTGWRTDPEKKPRSEAGRFQLSDKDHFEKMDSLRLTSSLE